MEETVQKLTDQIVLWLQIAWLVGFFFGSVIGIGTYLAVTTWIENRRNKKTPP